MKRIRRSALAVGLATLATGLGCAPKAPPVGFGRSTGYEQLEQLDSEAAGFETAPDAVDPAEIVPLDLLQGPHHVIRSARLDDTLLYTFVIDSDFGELEVTGQGLLLKRVLEIEALAAYDERGLNGTEVFALDLANAAEEPVEGTLQIIRHPVRTVTNIPRGVARSFKQVKQMSRGGRTHLEDDYSVEMIGLSGQKRLWADRLGVDPYSTNPYVQSRLTRNGWLSLLGSLSVRVATIPVPAGGATIALSAVGATSSMNDQLEDETPEDTRVHTREFLTDELGVDPELAEKFLAHPWYPPTKQETILHALASLDGVEGRDVFIEMAARADEAHEAYAFTRLALMFAESHARRAPLSEIVVVQDLLVGRTSTGRAVVPLYVDRLLWTEQVAETEAELSGALRASGDGPPLLLVSGELTPRAERELGDRGWLLSQGLEEQWLAGIDLDAHLPAEPDDSRILPELGEWASHASGRIARHREAILRDDPSLLMAARAVPAGPNDTSETEAADDAESPIASTATMADDELTEHAELIERAGLIEHPGPGSEKPTTRLAGLPESSAAE
jgi:hypothetical protein